MRHLQARHPKGTPTGGRFAPAGASEADLTLQPALDLGQATRVSDMTAADSHVLWHPGNETCLDTVTDETQVRWIRRGCGHIVEASARTLASQPHCGECNPPGYRHPWLDMDVDPATTLHARNPALADCIDPDLNGGWTADRIPADYRGTVVWSMPGCGHTYRAKVKGRTDTACAVCEGRVLVPGVNDLHTLHPDIAATVLPRLNGGLHPIEVKPTEQLRRLAWQDPACGHTWRDTPYSRVVLGRGCPECARSSQDAA